MIARIKKVLQNADLSASKFANEVGMNQPTVTRQLNGMNGITFNLVCEVLNFFPDISAEWLLRGIGEMEARGEVVVRCKMCEEKEKRIAVMEKLIAMYERQVVEK